MTKQLKEEIYGVYPTVNSLIDPELGYYANNDTIRNSYEEIQPGDFIGRQDKNSQNERVERVLYVSQDKNDVDPYMQEKSPDEDNRYVVTISFRKGVVREDADSIHCAGYCEVHTFSELEKDGWVASSPELFQHEQKVLHEWLDQHPDKLSELFGCRDYIWDNQTGKENWEFVDALEAELNGGPKVNLDDYGTTLQTKRNN